MAPIRVIICACAIWWQIEEVQAMRKQNKESSGKAANSGELATEAFAAAVPGACAGVQVLEGKEGERCEGPDGEEMPEDHECCREFVRCEAEAPTSEADYQKVLDILTKGCAVQPSEYVVEGEVTTFRTTERLCGCNLDTVMGREFKETRDGRRAFQGAPLDRDVFWLPKPFRRVCFDFEETSEAVKAASRFVRGVLSAFEARSKCPRICGEGDYPETCVVPFPPWAGSPAVKPVNCQGNLFVVQLPKKSQQYYAPVRVTSASLAQLDIRRMKGSRTGDFVRIQQRNAKMEVELGGKMLAQTEKLELGLKGAKAPSDQYDPPTETGESPFVTADRLSGCVDQSYWSHVGSK